MASKGISYTLGLDGSKFAGGLRTATAGVAGLTTKMSGLAAKGAASFAGLTLKVAGLATAVAGLAGSVGAVQSVKLAGGVEQAEISYKNLFGTIEDGRKSVAALNALEAATPFDIEELLAAGKSMAIATGSIDGMISKLTTLGNIAAAQSVPIQELALVYQKASTGGGIVQTEEINMIAERGIPIIEELERVMGAASGSWKKLAADGKISFATFDQALENIGGKGGRFGSAMEEQSRTTLGLLSTLKSAWKGVLIEFGRPFNDGLKPVIQSATDLLAGTLKPAAREIGVIIGGFVAKFHAVAAGAGGMAAGLKAAFKDAVDAFKGYLGALKQPLHTLFSGIGGALIDILKPSMEWIATKLTIAALRFSRTLKYALADALASLPGLIRPSVAQLQKLTGSGSADGTQSNLLEDQRIPQLETQIKEAFYDSAEKIAQAGGKASEEFKTGIAAVTSNLSEAARAQGAANTLSAAAAGDIGAAWQGAGKAVDAATQKAADNLDAILGTAGNLLAKIPASPGVQSLLNGSKPSEPPKDDFVAADVPARGGATETQDSIGTTEKDKASEESARRKQAVEEEIAQIRKESGIELAETTEQQIAALKRMGEALREDAEHYSVIGRGTDPEAFQSYKDQMIQVEEEIARKRRDLAKENAGVKTRREEFDIENKILALRAAGKKDAAEAAQKDLDARRLAADIQRDMKTGEEAALKIAKDRLALQAKADKKDQPDDGGRKTIRGFRQEQGRARDFAGLPEAPGLKGRLADGFKFDRLDKLALDRAGPRPAPGVPSPAPPPAQKVPDLGPHLLGLRQDVQRLLTGLSRIQVI